jgi:hypothetical protein
MNNISIFDETFDQSLASSYFLSIRISPDGFSFSTLDPVRNMFIQFKHVRFEMADKEWQQTLSELNDEKLFELEFQKVVVIVDNEFSMLVPNSLFKPEESRQLLSFTFDLTVLNSDYQIITNRVKMADATNVWALPDKLWHFLTAKFQNLIFLHSTTPVLEANLIEDHRNLEQSFIHLHFDENRFHVMVVDKRELKLSNHFKYLNINEMLYYFLFVIDQLKLPVSAIEIFVSGNISPQSELYHSLNAYIKRIRIVKPDKHLNFSPNFRHVDLSNHFQLFSFPLCVS